MRTFLHHIRLQSPSGLFLSSMSSNLQLIWREKGKRIQGTVPRNTTLSIKTVNTSTSTLSTEGTWGFEQPAVAYHLCLALPAEFSQLGVRSFSHPRGAPNHPVLLNSRESLLFFYPSLQSFNCLPLSPPSLLLYTTGHFKLHRLWCSPKSKPVEVRSSNLNQL